MTPNPHQKNPQEIRTSEQFINYPQILEEDMALLLADKARWSWSWLSADEQGLSSQEESPQFFQVAVNFRVMCHPRSAPHQDAEVFSRRGPSLMFLKLREVFFAPAFPEDVRKVLDLSPTSSTRCQPTRNWLHLFNLSSSGKESSNCVEARITVKWRCDF